MSELCLPLSRKRMRSSYCQCLISAWWTWFVPLTRDAPLIVRCNVNTQSLAAGRSCSPAKTHTKLLHCCTSLNIQLYRRQSGWKWKIIYKYDESDVEAYVPVERNSRCPRFVKYIRRWNNEISLEETLGYLPLQTCKGSRSFFPR